MKSGQQYYETPDSRLGLCRLPLLILVFSLFMISSCSPRLQNHHGSISETKSADQVIIEMKNWADLTDEQEVKVRPIIEAQVKRRNELIQKYKGKDRKVLLSMKDELKDLRVTTASQLQYFMTNKQMIEYGEMQQEEDERISREGKAGREMDPQKPGGRGSR